MKADVRKWAAIVLVIAFADGCSSIRARTEILENDWAVYPGVRQDVKEMGGIFKGERSAPGWVNGLVTSVLVFDLPFSAIFDTFVLPYDWYRIRNPRPAEETRAPSEGRPIPESEDVGE